MLTLSNRT